MRPVSADTEISANTDAVYCAGQIGDVVNSIKKVSEPRLVLAALTQDEWAPRHYPDDTTSCMASQNLLVVYVTGGGKELGRVAMREYDGVCTSRHHVHRCALPGVGSIQDDA